jgi:hypothetical protein
MAESQRIWTPDDLKAFLNVSLSWIYNHTSKKALDPIPRCKGLRLLRFDTASKEFQSWLKRNLGVELDGTEKS